MEAAMAETLTYSVPGVHCAHCEAAIKQEVGAVPGVETVDVDLDAKEVTINGSGLEDARLRAAIDEAGYDTV
jgi:copper chaperone